MAQAAVTPLQGSLPSTIDPRILEPEDSDAWEYEYSNTETENYFVTLDLTTPNVESRRRVKPAAPIRFDNNKGRWKSHGVSSQRRDRPPSPKSYRFTEGGEGGRNIIPATEAETSRRTTERDLGQMGQGNKKSLEEEDNDDREENEEGPKEEQRRNPDPVQILDLHSETPMVSYRGQVFACDWASNMGTELLFTARDQESQLPVLRSLRGEVDLLAASSCRLVPRAVTLEAKIGKRSRMATDLPNYSTRGRDGPRISIPVGPGASQKRKDQARFLERFTSIKQEKGEDDQITIIAQKRQLNNKWKLIWRKKRQTERSKLMRFIMQQANSPKHWEEVEKAKQRLQKIEAEDGIQRNQPQMASGGYESLNYISGKKTHAMSEASAGGVNVTMSTPASQPWMDVDAEGELDGYMENQEYMEDMDYGEYDEMLYENDPGNELYE